MVRWLIGLGVVMVAGFAHAQEAGVSPEQAEALNEAQRHYEQQDYAQAAGVLEDLVAEAPALAEAHRLLGHVRYELGEPAAARAAFTDAIGRGRVTVAMLERLVALDQQAGRLEAALAGVRWRSLLTDAAEADWTKQRAELLLEMGQAEAAARAAASVTADRPGDRTAWLLLGNARLAAGEDRSAAAALTMGYFLGRTDGALARTIGEVWQRQDRPGRAAKWLGRAARLTSGADRRAVVLRRGRVLAAGELTDRPVDALTELVESEAASDEQRGEAAFVLGQLAEQRGETEAALDHWRRAVELGHARPAVLARLGAAHYNAARYEQAAKYLGQRLDAGEDARLRQFLVRSLIESGQVDAARTALKRYVAEAGLDETARRLARRWRAAQD